MKFFCSSNNNFSNGIYDVYNRERERASFEASSAITLEQTRAVVGEDNAWPDDESRLVNVS